MQLRKTIWHNHNSNFHSTRKLLSTNIQKENRSRFLFLFLAFALRFLEKRGPSNLEFSREVRIA